MPVVAVNLAPRVLDEIRLLVEVGNYASPEQFLEIAAFNQLALEKGSDPGDAQTSSRKASGSEGVTARGALPVASHDAVRQQPEAVRATRVSSRRTGPREVSESEVADVMRRLALPLVTEGRPPSIALAPRPDSERVWGQVNRLFPLKLACRAILKSAVGKRTWHKLDSITEQLGKDASILGSALEKADHAGGRKRDDLLATGLPRKGNIASESRFLSQFVARTTRAGDIYAGAVCHYALADFDGERIGLTESGVELARLANPLLDGGRLEAATSMLSDEERSFFVRQVVSFVPGELRDFKIILSIVGAGGTTPGGLLAVAPKSFPDTWTPLMVRTHVSGIVARLAELEFIARRWEGRNVRYERTDPGALMVVA